MKCSRCGKDIPVVRGYEDCFVICDKCTLESYGIPCPKGCDYEKIDWNGLSELPGIEEALRMLEHVDMTGCPQGCVPGDGRAVPASKYPGLAEVLRKPNKDK